MYKIIPIFAITLFLAFMSSRFSVYNEDTKYIEHKDKIFSALMAICLILFVGLRTRYNDTTTYIGMYETWIIPTREGFESIDWKIGSNPGFMLVNHILKYLGASTQTFIMFYAIITNGIYIWFIRKYNCDYLFSIFLYLTIGGFVFTLAAMKQCVAVAFCLIGTDRAINRKYAKFVFWVLIAMTFHPYALMYLIVPFLDFKPFSKKTFYMLAFFGIAAISLNSLLGNIVDITSMMGEGYDVESFSGEGVNPFRVVVMLVPILLSFITRRVSYNSNGLGGRVGGLDDRVSNIVVNLASLNGEIMFVGLFGTANYFARLANYFVIFQTLSIPYLIKRFDKKYSTIIRVLAIVGYLLFFVYENAIKDSFDIHFDSITLLEYIKSIIGG